MKIAVIAAMHEECESLRSSLNQAQHSQVLNISISKADWHGHELTLIESGIGKVNATLATQIAIKDFGAELVINTGSAGGIMSEASIGDFVVADRICHHDIDISPIGFELGALPNLPAYYDCDSDFTDRLLQTCQENDHQVHRGNIASADSFVYKNDQIKYIHAHFDDIIACEMEAGAVAQVCHLYQVPLVLVRNLSDIAGKEAPQNFQKHIEQAGQKSSQLVLQFVAQIIS